jgi:hypothetical protein
MKLSFNIVKDRVVGKIRNWRIGLIEINQCLPLGLNVGRSEAKVFE